MSMIRKLVAVFGSLMAMTASGSDYSDLKVQPGEWRTLAPGQPRAKFPTVRVIEEGKGPAVELGNLVKLNVRIKHVKPEPIWQDHGDWWIWIGFLTDQETPLFSNSPRIASALIGLREGTLFEFVDAHDDPTMDPGVAGKLYTNVVGSQREYRWRKILENDTKNVSVSFPKEGRDVHLKILMTCKAALQIRSVHLFDDSPVRVWQGFDTHLTKDPREMWIDEGRVQGKCADGRTATFRYGPLPTGGRSPVIGYFDKWLSNEWEKLPVGVQIDNNRPPVVPHRSVPSTITTRVDTPVNINVLAHAKDPDGDRLTARIDREPANGKLAANADGSFTYTPNKGWAGVDEFDYKASDGMTESKPGRWRITVEK